MPDGDCEKNVEKILAKIRKNGRASPELRKSLSLYLESKKADEIENASIHLERVANLARDENIITDDEAEILRNHASSLVGGKPLVSIKPAPTKNQVSLGVQETKKKVEEKTGPPPGKHIRVFIAGYPGSGKTTFLTMIHYRYAYGGGHFQGQDIKYRISHHYDYSEKKDLYENQRPFSYRYLRDSLKKIENNGQVPPTPAAVTNPINISLSLRSPSLIRKLIGPTGIFITAKDIPGAYFEDGQEENLAKYIEPYLREPPSVLLLFVDLFRGVDLRHIDTISRDDIRKKIEGNIEENIVLIEKLGMIFNEYMKEDAKRRFRSTSVILMIPKRDIYSHIQGRLGGVQTEEEISKRIEVCGKNAFGGLTRNIKVEMFSVIGNNAYDFTQKKIIVENIDTQHIEYIIDGLFERRRRLIWWC